MSHGQSSTLGALRLCWQRNKVRIRRPEIALRSSGCEHVQHCEHGIDLSLSDFLSSTTKSWPATLNSNGNNALVAIQPSKPASPQTELDRGIDKQVEIDGIGMRSNRRHRLIVDAIDKLGRNQTRGAFAIRGGRSVNALRTVRFLLNGTRRRCVMAECSR